MLIVPRNLNCLYEKQARVFAEFKIDINANGEKLDLGLSKVSLIGHNSESNHNLNNLIDIIII